MERPDLVKLTTEHLDDETLEALFDKLTSKTFSEFTGRRVRSGWVKYSWNGSTWNLDDGAFVCCLFY